MKEQQPIGITELQQKIDRFNGALGKANRVSQTIGTPEFGRPELDISPSSQLNSSAYLDAAIKVGRVRKALTENAMPRLTAQKDQAQTQFNDLEVQNEKLQQVRELVAAGYIPATVLERSQESTGVKKTNNDVAERSQNREVISGDAVEEGFVVGKRIKYLNAVDLFVRTPEITLEEIIRVLPLAPNQQPASYARAFDDMSRTIFYIDKGADKGNATLQELAILKRIKEKIERKSQIPVDEEAISRVFSSRVAVRNWLESEIKAKGPAPKRDTRSVAIRKVDEDVERLRKQGLKNSEIALQLGIKLGRICTSVNRLIVAGRIERRITLPRGEVTETVAKRNAQIKQLRNEGLNNKIIAQQLEVSESTVAQAVTRLIKAGEMITQSIIANERVRFDDQVEQLRRQGLSYDQIAKQLGRKKSRVNYSIRRLISAGRIERTAQQNTMKRDRDTLEEALIRHLSENPKKAVPLAELAREVGINSSRTFNLYQQIAKEKKVPLLRLGRSRTR